MSDTKPYAYHESVVISRTGTTHSAYDLYGNYIGQYYATDYASASSERIDILSTRPGTIVFAGWDNSGYGNLVIIRYDNGEYGFYAHMRSNTLNVSTGDSVGQGHVLGDMGNTGNSTGRHLHYERRIQRYGQTLSNTYNPNFIGFYDPNTVAEPEPEIISQPEQEVSFAKHDMNGDGVSDIVLHNNTTETGATSIWYMQNGDSLYSKRTFALGANSYWKILTADIDVNGDKKGDIFLHNSVTGETTTWLDNDLEYPKSVRSANLNPYSGYEFTVAGDFNGDDRDEVVWFRESDNRLSLYSFKEDASYDGYRGVLYPEENFKPIFAGDFNGDNVDDMLMYNQDSGEMYINAFDFDGQVKDSYNIPTVDPLTGWNPIAAIDANGDGREDLFFMKDRGDLTQWQAQADGSMVSVGYVDLPYNLGWELGSSGDFNGDGYEELSFYRPSDGRHTTLLNGADGQFNGDASFIANQVSDWEIIA